MHHHVSTWTGISPRPFGSLFSSPFSPSRWAAQQHLEELGHNEVIESGEWRAEIVVTRNPAPPLLALLHSLHAPRNALQSPPSHCSLSGLRLTSEPPGLLYRILLHRSPSNLSVYWMASSSFLRTLHHTRQPVRAGH